MQLFTLALISTKTVTVGHFIAAVVIALILGLLIGAQLTTHEERSLDYNLEDEELDALKRLEGYADRKELAVLTKLKAAAAALKLQSQMAKQKAVGAVKSDVSKL